jgi:hypothetical protein
VENPEGGWDSSTRFDEGGNVIFEWIWCGTGEDLFE